MAGVLTVRCTVAEQLQLHPSNMALAAAMAADVCVHHRRVCTRACWRSSWRRVALCLLRSSHGILRLRLAGVKYRAYLQQGAVHAFYTNHPAAELSLNISSICCTRRRNAATSPCGRNCGQDTSAR